MFIDNSFIGSREFSLKEAITIRISFIGLERILLERSYHHKNQNYTARYDTRILKPFRLSYSSKHENIVASQKVSTKMTPKE